MMGVEVSQISFRRKSRRTGTEATIGEIWIFGDERPVRRRIREDVYFRGWRLVFVVHSDFSDGDLQGELLRHSRHERACGG